jgi:hypothetical protein
VQIIFYVGVLVSLLGSIWFIFLSISTGKSLLEKLIWSVVSLFCQPVGGLIFYFIKKNGFFPLLFVLVGAILMIAGVFSDLTINLFR